MGLSPLSFRLESKSQQLGKIYQLITQFDLISRTDLAKLSGLAPATITALTKMLIDHQLVVEQTSKDPMSRGRPAVGLAISREYWRVLAVHLSSQSMEISLCDMMGKAMITQDYPLNQADYSDLTQNVAERLRQFFAEFALDQTALLAISISVIGRTSTKGEIVQLGDQSLHCPLQKVLQAQFELPILVNEHFSLWLSAEAVTHHLQGEEGLFLHLGEEIQMSVLLRGALPEQPQHTKMNVAKMLMPKLSPLCDEIFPELAEIERYQLANQIRFSAIEQLIDRYFPSSLATQAQKIAYLCDQIKQSDVTALTILRHIADNLAYVLMNLINLFSTQKVVIQSSLLQVKEPLFEAIQRKLQDNLLNDIQVELVGSQYDNNHPLIACVAVKQALSSGELFKRLL